MRTPSTTTTTQQPQTRAGRTWEARGRAALRSETLLAAELAALCGFVFARPVLGSFGASAETFIARGASGLDIVVFGLAVALVPVLGLALVGAAGRALGLRRRFFLHLLTIGVLGALATTQVLRINVQLGSAAVGALSVLAGTAMAVVRWRIEAAKTFLRYAGIAPVVFLVQFLAFSPVSSLLQGGRSASVDPEVAAAVEAAVGEDPPHVVVVMLDALSTTTLMDGEGSIDRDVYPNLAGLADEATWYINHTTVAPVTLWALPAFLTGAVPRGDDTAPVASVYPENLFTLLGGVYDVHAVEQITALCPQSLCPDAVDGQLRPLLGDARWLWRQSLTDEPAPELVPGAFHDRYERFAVWLEQQVFDRGDHPGLFFYHLLLPHTGWDYLPDGQRYAASRSPIGALWNRWGDIGWDVGLQRHLLQTQAVDQQLGRLFGRLRAAGTYDDALILVTADHGMAFEPHGPQRALAESQYEQIMWTPLLIKTPGQTEGQVDRRNVWSVDVLPIIASELGIDLEELGWTADGLVPGAPGPQRDPNDKAILDWPYNELRAEPGQDLVTVDGAEGLDRVESADLIEGSGPLAVWQRTRYGDLLGATVDELSQGEPTEVELEVQNLDWFDDVDQAVPPLEFLGFGWLEPDETVVVAVNGTVAALVPARETPFGVSAVHGLLHPEALVTGHNDLAAYHVSGDPDDPVLRRLDVIPREE